jgi:Xaa-Pro aminopeptidase
MLQSDRRSERQDCLRRRLAESALDALLVSHPPNIRYLTGFTGSAAMLLVSAERTVLLTDPRYAVQAPAEVRGLAEVEIEPANLWERLKIVVAGLRPGVLGFERDRVTVEGAERLAPVGALRLAPVSGYVEGLRLTKDASEVAAIRAAAALALEALDELLPTLRPGESERAIAARLEAALRVRGSEWHPFQTIVASGPNSALPHARASARTLQAGEFLLLDFGAQVDGYCADLARTVVVGAPADSRQRQVYDAVRSAEWTALTGIRAGMSGREADALARRSLADAGLAEAFRHSLGHGLGLEVHENPRLSPTAEGRLPVGAVVTVEPGVYFEGWGGVRLEDDVLLTSEAPELLSPGAPELPEVL